MSFNAPGFEKDFNFPGDTQGETNGYYAAVTTNNSYDPNDPTSGVDLASILQAVPGIARSAIGTIQDTRTAIAAASQPTFTEQWLKASLIEKVTLGVVTFVALRWIINDFR